MWKVMADRLVSGKRFVHIRDTDNNKDYANYFRQNVSNTAIRARFRAQVKESRAIQLQRETIVAKGKVALDLSTFEDGL